jgi:hypothetical protein
MVQWFQGQGIMHICFCPVDHYCLVCLTLKQKNCRSPINAIFYPYYKYIILST